MKILPVKLCGPAVSIFTYALIDDGSTVSLIDERIADQIVITGERTRLSLKGISGDDGIVYLSKRVSCQIQGIPEGPKYVLQDVFTILNLRLPRQTITLKDTRSHPHLRDINLATYENVQPTLLLGQDNVDLIVVLESKVGKKDTPVASRTKLGWALHGREKRTGFASQGLTLLSREEENSVISEVSPDRRNADMELHNIVEECIKLKRTEYASRMVSELRMNGRRVYSNPRRITLVVNGKRGFCGARTM